MDYDDASNAAGDRHATAESSASQVATPRLGAHGGIDESPSSDGHDPDGVGAPVARAEVGLDPNAWDELQALGHRALDDVFALLQTAGDRPAWQSVPDDVKASFRTSPPFAPASPSSVYDDVRRRVLPYATGNIHPRFWGWVMGTGSATGVIADLITSALNANAIGGDQASTYVELEVLRWLKEMLGFPDEASGILVSGGSVANLVGLTAARNARAELASVGAPSSATPAHRAGYPVLYCSTETHNSVTKAVALLGLGAHSVRLIPTGANYSIDVAALNAAIEHDRAHGRRPFCIVGNAGTVNTGAFDDFHALADVAAMHEMWFHVDGAFGALASLSPTLRRWVAGMERADSIAVDLHKWLHMSYDVGCAFVRHVDVHRASFAQFAAYLDPQARGFAAGSHWFAEYGPQLSRGNRALKVWMELKTHGVQRYADLIDQNVAQAAHLAKLIQRTPGFELTAPVPLNVVCFRMVEAGASEDVLNALNKELLLRLQESGIALPSSTVLEGRYVVRVAITNHRTRLADLGLFMDAASAIAAALRAERLRPVGGRSGAAELRIVEYRREHQAVVRDLNLAWIERHFAAEPRDHRELGDPDTYILRTGGAIWIAELDGVPIGTCSLLREADGSYELGKMAVSESARGRGAGRALAEAVIARARAMGIERLELFTNTILAPAIALYRSLGFVDAPLGHSAYGRANVRMVLTLRAEGSPAPRTPLTTSDAQPLARGHRDES